MKISDYDNKVEWYKCFKTGKEESLYDECKYITYIGEQFVEVVFQCDEIDNTSKKIRHWNIGLTIADDEELIEYYHKNKMITGKIGVCGLLFAKAAIKAFEEVLTSNEEYISYNHCLYCEWLDKRRKKVYCYGLKKIGFDLGFHYYNRKIFRCLKKKIYNF